MYESVLLATGEVDASVWAADYSGEWRGWVAAGRLAGVSRGGDQRSGSRGVRRRRQSVVTWVCFSPTGAAASHYASGHDGHDSRGLVECWQRRRLLSCRF